MNVRVNFMAFLARLPLLLVLVTSVSSCGEFIPSKENTRTILSAKFNDEGQSIAPIMFEKSGRYKVGMGWRIKDPKYGVEPEKFTIGGTIQVKDYKGRLIHDADFSIALQSNNGSCFLDKFDVNFLQLEKTGEMEIKITSGFEEMKHYFEDLGYGVSRSPKYSILD